MNESDRAWTARRAIPESFWAAAFVSPAALLLAVFAIGPIAASLWLSLHRRLPIFDINEFVGASNYVAVLLDDRFWNALGVTTYFTLVSVALELLLGLGIAVLLDSGVSGTTATADPPHKWARMVMLVPWAVPTVVSARMWEWLYQPEYGLLNYLLLSVGVIATPINWLGSSAATIHAAILMDVWKATPFAALLLLGALQAIPRDLYLAARVDGAGWWAQFRRITLPLLAPVILIVLTFRTMDAFRVFDAVYVLTGGGPGNSTETLSIYTYKTLFQSLQFGYGSAQATMMFLLVALLACGYLFLLRRRLRETEAS